MKTHAFKFFTIAILIFGFNTVFAQNADSLLRKMDNLMSAFKDRTATVKIILTDNKGEVKEREAEMKQKGTDMKLYRYTKPEKQAGVCTLSLPGDVMWLFMPAFDEPIRISLLAKSQAFTGTDFSYEDMESRSYSQRYSPSLLETSDPKVYVLKLEPAPDNKSKYTKILLYLNKEFFYPEKMEYFDKRDEMIKVATYKYSKQGKYWYAEEVLMKDLKKNHSTGIIMTELKFDQGLKDDEFTVEKLQE